MSEKMNDVISERDAASRKASLHPELAAAPIKQCKEWHFQNFASTAAAVTFVNTPPVQVAGEVSTTTRNDGTVGLFYFL